MNWFKFFGKRKKLKGFTLTELIVVSAIMVLLMACVVAFAGPVRMMIGNTTAKDDALTINKIIGDYIERKLAYANYIDIYVGYPYDTSDTKLKDSFDTVKARKGLTGQDNKPGMLIFRYADDATDPLKSTFKVYDIPITSASATMPSSITADNVVFIDEFYNGYEYFITTDDTSIQANSLRKHAYLNFRVDSFNFKDEYTKGFKDEDTVGVSGKVITDYYAYIDGGSTGTNPFQRFTEERTGSEVVSFTLENIPVDTHTVDDDGDGVFDRVEATTPNVSITRGKTVGASTTYSTDMIVFYNIRKFDVKTSVS